MRSFGKAECLQVFYWGQAGVLFEQGAQIASVQPDIAGQLLNLQGFTVVVLDIADSMCDV